MMVIFSRMIVVVMYGVLKMSCGMLLVFHRFSFVGEGVDTLEEDLKPGEIFRFQGIPRTSFTMNTS